MTQPEASPVQRFATPATGNPVSTERQTQGGHVVTREVTKVRLLDVLLLSEHNTLPTVYPYCACLWNLPEGVRSRRDVHHMNSVRL